MSRPRIDAWHDALNRMILQHPVAAVVISALALLVVTRTPGDSIDYGSAPTWFTLLAVALIAYGGIMVWAYPRLVKRPVREVASVMWALALAAGVIGMIAPFVVGAPRWVPGLGFLTAMLGLIYTVRAARSAPPSHA